MTTQEANRIRAHQQAITNLREQVQNALKQHAISLSTAEDLIQRVDAAYRELPGIPRAEYLDRPTTEPRAIALHENDLPDDIKTREQEEETRRDPWRILLDGLPVRHHREEEVAQAEASRYNAYFSGRW